MSRNSRVRDRGYISGKPVIVAPTYDEVLVNYLVVAGGGGGGASVGVGGGGQSAGGGAGGYKSTGSEGSGGGGPALSSQTLLVGTSYSVTVGGGGAGGTTSGNKGSDGSTSSFTGTSAISSTGGGGGGAYLAGNRDGRNGGSGGGAAGASGTGGAGTANEGFAGGSVGAGLGGGAGGGGAGAAGQAVTTSEVGGNGGAGLTSSFDSTARGGGGGGGGATSGGTASAGGGKGGDSSTARDNGTANTGGGGGGSRGAVDGAGGNGGSGVIVLRYSNLFALTVGAGLAYSTQAVSDDKVTTFTGGSGSVSFSLVPVTTGDYESIATMLVGSAGASSITFSNIPQTYKHLQIRMLIGSNTSTSDSTDMRFNGDAGSNYTYHQLYGTGSSVGSEASTPRTAAVVGIPAISNTNTNIFATGVVDILDYANTNKYKTQRTLGGWETNSNGQALLTTTSWLSFSAISQIQIYARDGHGFKQHSHFALYGIRG